MLLQFGGQSINLYRNIPARVRLAVKDEYGSDYTAETMENPVMVISSFTSFDEASLIRTITDWGLNFGFPEKIFSIEDIKNLPLGTFAYEFGASLDGSDFQTISQGQIIVGPTILDGYVPATTGGG
jgi:hypothetical protein